MKRNVSFPIRLCSTNCSPTHTSGCFRMLDESRVDRDPMYLLVLYFLLVLVHSVVLLVMFFLYPLVLLIGRILVRPNIQTTIDIFIRRFPGRCNLFADLSANRGREGCRADAGRVDIVGLVLISASFISKHPADNARIV